VMLTPERVFGGIAANAVNVPTSSSVKGAKLICREGSLFSVFVRNVPKKPWLAGGSVGRVGASEGRDGVFISLGRHGVGSPACASAVGFSGGSAETRGSDGFRPVNRERSAPIAGGGPSVVACVCEGARPVNRERSAPMFGSYGVFFIRGIY
jgi:hypothetical protein